MSTSENTAAAALDPPLAFLQPLIGRGRPYSHRPWVTLTYAQSLDGKLAGPKGKQIHLSGRESKAMTHRCVD
jgi:2,5-diamino-6-(ribosylamino)-4(3H)-pyrimidinone 5'-phosphate reductase